MAIKKNHSYKGFPTRDIYYDIISIKFNIGVDEEDNEIWRVIVTVRMYSNINRSEMLEPQKEYYVGDIDNTSLMTYNKALDLLKLHEKFIGAIDC